MFESVCYQKMNPAAVIVDETVIVQAPVRFLVSGMGDALATWFEAESCRQTRSANACGGLSTTLGQHIARLCCDILLEYGLAAKIACENRVITPAFARIVEANTLHHHSDHARSQNCRPVPAAGADAGWAYRKLKQENSNRHG